MAYSIMKRGGLLGNDLYIEDYTSPDEFNSNYWRGKSLELDIDSVFRFWVYEERHIRRDYLTGVFAFPIVSTRFREIIDKHEKFCEFYQAEILFELTGEKDDEYFFLNILNNVKCFDWNLSKYTQYKESGAVRNIFDLKLNESVLKGRHLARMAEDPSIILVSEELREDIELASLVGIELVSLNQYQSQLP